jgi:hypothetical protein
MGQTEYAADADVIQLSLLHAALVVVEGILALVALLCGCGAVAASLSPRCVAKESLPRCRTCPGSCLVAVGLRGLDEVSGGLEGVRTTSVLVQKGTGPYSQNLITRKLIAASGARFFSIARGHRRFVVAGQADLVTTYERNWTGTSPTTGRRSFRGTSRYPIRPFYDQCCFL